MKNTTKLGTSMYYPIIDWVEPNLSFIKSAPYHIPTMNVGSHETNQTKPNQGFHRPNNPNPQLVIPPHGQTSLTPTKSVSTQAANDSRN